MTSATAAYAIKRHVCIMKSLRTHDAFIELSKLKANKAQHEDSSPNLKKPKVSYYHKYNIKQTVCVTDLHLKLWLAQVTQYAYVIKKALS